MATAVLAPPSSFSTMGHTVDICVPEMISEMRKEVNRLAGPIGQAISKATCGQPPQTWDQQQESVQKSYKKKNRNKTNTRNSHKIKDKGKGVDKGSSAGGTGSGSSSSRSRNASRPPVSERHAEIERARRLWRAFRRRMRQEQQEAIKEEEQLQQQQERTKEYQGCEAVLRDIEEENEEWALVMAQREPLIVVDCGDEPSMFEMILPRGFQSMTGKGYGDHPVVEQKERSVFTSYGGLVDMFNLFTTGKTTSDVNNKKKVLDDATAVTAVTSDESLSLSLSRSLSIESHLSWESWNSALTEKAGNVVEAREFLVHLHGGEKDTPWQAAKRGDLDALVNRWKNRHDWTLQNEDGDEPLYLACRYGGARNPRVVLFLLQQWPSTVHIPKLLLARCIADSATVHVEKILMHPHLAEMIIRDFDEHVLMVKQRRHGTGQHQRLGDIREEQDEDIELHAY